MFWASPSPACLVLADGLSGALRYRARTSLPHTAMKRLPKSAEPINIASEVGKHFPLARFPKLKNVHRGVEADRSSSKSRPNVERGCAERPLNYSAGLAHPLWRPTSLLSRKPPRC